jgi:hypothetical protein
MRLSLVMDGVARVAKEISVDVLVRNIAGGNRVVELWQH